MEQEYLIDTNTVIDYLDDKLPDKNAHFIDGITIRVSVITRMELLGWTKAKNEQVEVLQQFVNSSIVFNLEDPVILKTIELRKAVHIKLPDAIIAATALINGLTLVTHNVHDFKDIKGLKLLDPFKT